MQQKRAMNRDVIVVGPLSTVQALEPSVLWIEGIKQVAVQRIQSAIELLRIWIPPQRIKADPSVEPRGIGHKVRVSPAPADRLLPAIELFVAQRVRLNRSRTN